MGKRNCGIVFQEEQTYIKEEKKEEKEKQEEEEEEGKEGKTKQLRKRRKKVDRLAYGVEHQHRRHVLKCCV